MQRVLAFLRWCLRSLSERLMMALWNCFAIGRCWRAACQQESVPILPSASKASSPITPTPPPERMNFGMWLRRQRTERQLKQSTLADQLHVSSSFLSRLEKGEKTPSMELLQRLARVWGMDLRRLQLRAHIIPDDILEHIACDVEGFLAWHGPRQQNP